jgi:MFS superfamily sulfate permease-like transporter
VLLLGILHGILLAALASILLLLANASRPHVAFLGRIPGTNSYSDIARHPENEPTPHVLAFRPEASLLYVNADAVLDRVRSRLRLAAPSGIRLVVCDLSASPYLDLAGCRMLHELHDELATDGIGLRIVGARGRLRDLLRAAGLGEKVGGVERTATLDSLLGDQRT